jgi:hypothetical protein
MRFRIDDWVIYCRFPDTKFLSDEKHRAVVLAVLYDDPIYDYKICIDDGTAKIIKVRAKNLEALKNEDT